jgi:hypothetical protein
LALGQRRRPANVLLPDGTPASPAEDEEPIQRRFDLATAAVVEVCALPPTMEEWLGNVAGVGPEHLLRVVMGGVAEDTQRLEAACGPGAMALIDALAGMDPAQRVQATVDGCTPGVEGLAPRETLVTLPFERLITAAVVYRWLAAQAEPHAVELGRLLLGLGLTLP